VRANVWRDSAMAYCRCCTRCLTGVYCTFYALHFYAAHACRDHTNATLRTAACTALHAAKTSARIFSRGRDRFLVAWRCCGRRAFTTVLPPFSGASPASYQRSSGAPRGAGLKASGLLRMD